MERTSTQFDAIYENGVLRPLSPVNLPSDERLSVIVNRPADALADVLDWDAHELAATEGDDRVSLDTALPNTLVIFEGAKVLHKVTRLGPDETRIMLSMTFSTTPRASLVKAVARRIKDVAFFGIRALWT